MAVKIRELDIEIPGKVVRKYDEASDITTFQVNQAQIQAIAGELAEAVAFINGGADPNNAHA
jgi:hypothetical protein